MTADDIHIGFHFQTKAQGGERVNGGKALQNVLLGALEGGEARCKKAGRARFPPTRVAVNVPKKEVVMPTDFEAAKEVACLAFVLRDLLVERFSVCIFSSHCVL